MVLELATVLLGACVGAVAVLYAAPKGYLGHRKNRSSTAKLDSYTPKTEQAVEVPAMAAPVMAESAPFPAPAFYETVQPAPAPVAYAPASSTSFGAPTLAKKPTRTYRRRTAPVRSTSGPKAARTAKSKKR